MEDHTQFVLWWEMLNQKERHREVAEKVMKGLHALIREPSVSDGVRRGPLYPSVVMGEMVAETKLLITVQNDLLLIELAVIIGKLIDAVHTAGGDNCTIYDAAEL